MELQFTCRKCGAETDVDLAELSDDPVLVCEACGAEGDPTQVGDVAATLEEFLSSAARLARSFVISVEVDGEEDLPATALGGPVIDDDDDEDEDDL